MNKLVEANTEKVLLIRMLSSADVCAIGLPVLRYFQKNNARNIIYMAVLVFLRNLNLRKNACSRTAS